MHPQRSQKGAADVKRLRCRLPAALSPNCNPSHLQRFTGLCAGDKARREESHKLCKLAPFVLHLLGPRSTMVLDLDPPRSHLDPPGAPPRSQPRKWHWPQISARACGIDTERSLESAFGRLVPLFATASLSYNLLFPCYLILPMGSGA